MNSGDVICYMLDVTQQASKTTVWEGENVEKPKGPPGEISGSGECSIALGLYAE